MDKLKMKFTRDEWWATVAAIEIILGKYNHHYIYAPNFDLKYLAIQQFAILDKLIQSKNPVWPNGKKGKNISFSYVQAAALIRGYQQFHHYLNGHQKAILESIYQTFDPKITGHVRLQSG